MKVLLSALLVIDGLLVLVLSFMFAFYVGEQLFSGSIPINGVTVIVLGALVCMVSVSFAGLVGIYNFLRETE